MNIREVLRELGIDFREGGTHHHVSSGWLGLDCPCCSPETGKFRLGINAASLACSCWVCGAVPLYEAIRDSTRDPSQVGLLLKGVQKERKAPRKARGRLQVPCGVGELLAAHRRYLRSRKFDPDTLQRDWGLQGIGPCGGKLSWRIWIPVTQNRETVSWTARSLCDEGKRYHTAGPEEEKVPAKSLLYGGDRATNAVLITEGPTGPWRFGFGCVATLGLSYTREQLWAMVRYPVRAVVFDSEKKAQERANNLCEDLSCFAGRTVRVELDSADPGEASEKEVKQLRRLFLE